VAPVGFLQLYVFGEGTWSGKPAHTLPSGFSGLLFSSLFTGSLYLPPLISDAFFLLPEWHLTELVCTISN
jgi:hypothetical protein